MQLTSDEEQIILKYRAEKAGEERAEKLIIHILQTASLFEKWMLDTGLGATYSTFCDDFGYIEDPPLEIGRKVVYDEVMGVLVFISERIKVL